MENHFMSPLNRQQISIYRSRAEADDGGYMLGTPAERLSEVWELTREAWAFFRNTNAEQRPQRDVAVLIRENVPPNTFSLPGTLRVLRRPLALGIDVQSVVSFELVFFLASAPL